MFAPSLGRFLCVVMEFCSEGPLTRYIGSSTDNAQRNKWIIDLARGLQHIHLSLIIHRDIKPDNLLVAIDTSGQQTIKYIDFGLAIELSEPTSIVDDGKQAGTPTYFSPELEARQPYAFPTDLWSLGVVFLQIFTGASEMDLLTSPFLKSRKTTEVTQDPVSVAIPALESDVTATRILDLVLQSDQCLRPTANVLVEFVVKMPSPVEAAANASD